MPKIEDIQVITDSIRMRVGEENSALISNDLLGLSGMFADTLNESMNKDMMIEKLTKEKQELLAVNGQLYQKIGFANGSKPMEEDEEDKKIDISEIVNEKGDLI
jgi:hypothetical protein